MDDAALAHALRRLDPGVRSDLRKLLICDQPDRDAIAELSCPCSGGRMPGTDDLANLIDMLTLDDASRRRVAWLLGEIEAADSP